MLGRIAGLFLIATFFWSIYDQGSNTWVQFARDHMDLNFYGIHRFPPDQIQALNPVLIVLLLPLITVLWHALANRGLKLHATDKMLLGFILTTVTMGLMTVAGYLSESGKVSVWWELFGYLLITIAEICISVVGLELAFAAAPKSLKSFVTACWLVIISLGNIINSQITPLYPGMRPGDYFGILTLVLVPATIAFFFVGRRFNRKLAAWQADSVAQPPQ